MLPCQMYFYFHSSMCSLPYIEHAEVMRWKHFPCYWPFVRGIHCWLVIPLTQRVSNKMLWCFFESMPEPTVAQTVEIWQWFDIPWHSYDVTIMSFLFMTSDLLFWFILGTTEFHYDLILYVTNTTYNIVMTKVRISIELTHWGRDKMATFRRRHFYRHFLEWKYTSFN